MVRKRTIDDIREAFEAVDNWLALVGEVLVEQGHHPVFSAIIYVAKKSRDITLFSARILNVATRNKN